MKSLIKIQKELKAPKGQENKFGGYKYRSCEDILEAVKPLLGNATLTITDEIVLIGDRYYVKATAKLKDAEWETSTTAFARECLDRKGMDASQITGATSSYARKYALNGLFLIDDTKDSDHTNEGVEVTQAVKVAKNTPTTPLKGIVADGSTPNCPVCGKAMRSTADAKASGKMKPNGPIFTCSDYKNCKGVVWGVKKVAPVAPAIPVIDMDEPPVDESQSEGLPF